LNFLIQSTTHDYKIKHWIAVQLDKLYPGSKFGVIISSHGDKKKFLDTQNELNYEFVYDISGIEKGFLKEEFSLEELREFEESIPEKSLWRFIAMDRAWGRAFCKGASKYFDPRTVPGGGANQENALKIACGYIRYFKKILSDLDANVVLFYPGTHSMKTPILEQSCRNMNILHLALIGIRVGNYFSISTNKHETFPHIEETYKKIVENEIDVDLTPGAECYDEMLSSAKDKGCSHNQRMVRKILSKFSKQKKTPSSYLYLLAKSLARSVLAWFKACRDQKARGIDIGRNGLKYFLFRSYDNLILAYQSKKLLDRSFYDEFDPNDKYLYYALNSQPEYATQVMDNMWINQLSIVEALAKSIPFDWKIYVKEHPATIGWRVRPFSFYRDIRQYPNVKLIPIDMDNMQVVKNSQMVVAISSTAAWEAVLFYNKPVITFSRAVYNVTGLARQCSDLTELSRLIYDECERINEVSVEERRKRLVALLNAILLNSIWINNPLATLTGSKDLSDREFEINARTMVSAIKKHIDGFYSM
jgi:hypothetical protein